MFHEQVSSDDVSHWMTSACLHVRLILLELVCIKHNVVKPVISSVSVFVLCFFHPHDVFVVF